MKVQEVAKYYLSFFTGGTIYQYHEVFLKEGAPQGLVDLVNRYGYDSCIYDHYNEADKYNHKKIVYQALYRVLRIIQDLPEISGEYLAECPIPETLIYNSDLLLWVNAFRNNSFQYEDLFDPKSKDDFMTQIYKAYYKWIRHILISTTWFIHNHL